MPDYSKAKAVLTRYSQLISAPDFAFAERVYNVPHEQYRARVEAVGFSGLEHVLDAGCGFGQWLLALSELNTNVSACDVSGERLLVASEICAELGIRNVQLRNASLDELPFEDKSFDAVFCYIVLHMTEWRSSILEFARVLKPGGRLYVTANGLGWYLHCWKNEPYKQERFDPKLMAALTFLNTVMQERGSQATIKGGELIIERPHLVRQLEETGFSIEQIGAEGTINVTGKTEIKPNFRAEYEGQPGVYEILACKKAG